MNKIVKIKLISLTVTYDAMGVMTKSETPTEIYGNFQSVSAQEFFRGGEIGIKPEFIIKVWENEYSGQVLLEYNNERYVIYRTYLASDGRVELYCQKDVGA